VADSGVEIEFAPLSRRPKILTSSAITETEIVPVVTRINGAVFYDGKWVDEDRGRICGLAVDWGTTTAVVELIDLETGGHS